MGRCSISWYPTIYHSGLISSLSIVQLYIPPSDRNPVKLPIQYGAGGAADLDFIFGIAGTHLYLIFVVVLIVVHLHIVGGTTGAVLESKQEARQTSGGSSTISEADAKRIALERAGLTAADYVKVDYDQDETNMR